MKSKRLLKTICLLLITVVTVTSSTLLTKADPTGIYVSAPNGGTWYMNSINIPSNETLIDVPIQSTYYTKSQISTLYYASYNTSSFNSAIKSLGAETIITQAIANTIKSKFGLNFVPYVGWAITLIDLYNCACTDAWKKAIKTAFNAGTGLQIDLYSNSMIMFAKCKLWTSGTIVYNHSLPNNSGYCGGYVALGKHDAPPTAPTFY